MAIDPVSSGVEAAGSIGSSIIGAVSANQQEQFQAQMSNTAHQRETKDLEKAGLNPILSATGGSGASTPQGTMFTPANPFAGIAQASIGNQMAKIQGLKTASDIALNLKLGKTEETKQAINSAAAAKTLAETPLTGQTQQLLANQINDALNLSNLHSAQYQGQINTNQEKQFYGSLYQAGNNVINWLKSTAKPVIDGAAKFKLPVYDDNQP